MAPRPSPSSAAYLVLHRSRVADIGADSELCAVRGPRSPPDADAEPRSALPGRRLCMFLFRAGR